MDKPQIIAFYLPQYHPTPNNDKWWGKGFTEWTNVGKAKPLFKGHYQPKVPADLGYYDLRLPEVREEQVRLAKEAGVNAFCYYHYWFGNGRQELELPFNEILKSGKPDFPFCLCWANESWHSKFWNLDGTIEKKTLVEQIYGNESEWEKHFNYLLPAFKDSRYYKINGKPLFMIYREHEFNNVKEFIKYWNNLALKNGLKGIYFIAQIAENISYENVKYIKTKGFDAINTVGLWKPMNLKPTIIQRIKRKLGFKLPYVKEYSNIYPNFISSVDSEENVFPTLIPNWDHSPRSGKAGYILMNSTPELFGKHVDHVFDIVKSKNNKLVFLKSWNEWGEGNYMEPDLKYGKGYINILKSKLEKL